MEQQTERGEAMSDNLTQVVRLLDALRATVAEHPDKKVADRDAWDKIRILSGVLAAVLVPLGLAVLGYYTDSALKNREVGVRMIELALNVIQRPEKTTAPSPDVKDDLYAWAFQVLGKYSGVELGQTAQATIREEGLSLSGPEIVGSIEVGRADDVEFQYRLAGEGELSVRLDGAPLQTTKSSEVASVKLASLSPGHHILTWSFVALHNWRLSVVLLVNGKAAFRKHHDHRDSFPASSGFLLLTVGE